jgi:hypothetical protein
MIDEFEIALGEEEGFRAGYRWTLRGARSSIEILSAKGEPGESITVVEEWPPGDDGVLSRSEGSLIHPEGPFMSFTSESPAGDAPPPEEDISGQPLKTWKVGDMANWESQGALQFPKPKKIKRIEDGHAFFAGAATGVPLGELVAGIS